VIGSGSQTVTNFLLCLTVNEFLKSTIVGVMADVYSGSVVVVWNNVRMYVDENSRTLAA